MVVSNCLTILRLVIRSNKSQGSSNNATLNDPVVGYNLAQMLSLPIFCCNPAWRICACSGAQSVRTQWNYSNLSRLCHISQLVHNHLVVVLETVPFIYDHIMLRESLDFSMPRHVFEVIIPNKHKSFRFFAITRLGYNLVCFFIGSNARFDVRSQFDDIILAVYLK